MLNLKHFEKIESYLPIDLLTVSGFFAAFGVVAFFVIVRYFISVYPFYFYFWKRSQSAKSWYLHTSTFSGAQIRTEIEYSVLSSFVFAFAGVLLGIFWQQGWTLIYLDLNRYGYFYLILSFLFLAFIHELYFYFTHRWMHGKKIFKHVHHVHHLSRNTSPWASFSFHPFEALILAAFLPLVVFILPLHPLVIISYMIFMTLSAISNHLGVEIFESSLIRKYLISGHHHSLHHKNYNSNYGLYFCFMDRLLKTEHSEVKK